MLNIAKNGGRVDMKLLKRRSQSKAKNRIGYISEGIAKPQIYRKDSLNMVDKYYNSKQYDHLPSWQEHKDGNIANSREVQPKMVYPFLRTLSDRLGAKLLGQNVFPDVSVEDDPEFEYFIGLVEREINLKAKLHACLKKLPLMGSWFIRTKVVDGVPDIESYESKFTYPDFGPSGELRSVTIKYIFEDEDDLDQHGKPVFKWHKIDLTENVDTTYDNPLYDKNVEPEFKVVSQEEHNLGFVQGEWFKTGIKKNTVDGSPIIGEEIFSFIDEFNYNLSKTAEAVEYGTDPQLFFKGMDENEVDDFVKSTAEAWLLGRENETGFLETSGAGAERADAFRDKSIYKYITDISRIVILDPEKIVGSAQSAKAMEVLHGPLLDLVNELRPFYEAGIKGVYRKMLATIIKLNMEGYELAFVMPPQYQPLSFDLTFSWPAVFPLTTQDQQQIISNAVQLANANILSRETALKWLIAQLPDIPVEDMEQEIQKINTQQQFNTFGGF